MRLLLLWLGSLLVIPAWAAEENAAVWLQRLVQASHTRAYEAVIVHQVGDALRSLRVMHRLQGGQIHEHWQILDDDVPDWRREHDRLHCVAVGCRERTALPAVVRASRQQDVLTYYDWHPAGTVRVAGREAMQWQLTPLDDWRHAHRLTLDRETGLLLALETRDTSDRVLERFRIVSLNWLDEDETPPEPAAVPDTEAAAPAWLPPGFRPLAAGADQQVYSDGLVTFSVFIETVGEPGPEAVLQRGATVLHARTVPSGEAFRRITVVGEIPVLAARRLVAALVSDVSRGR